MSPVIIGWLRGLILGAVTAGVGTAGLYITSHSDQLGNAWWVPIIPLLWRPVEGAWDKFVRGQAPQIPLGGRPANVTAYTSKGEYTP